MMDQIIDGRGSVWWGQMRQLFYSTSVVRSNGDTASTRPFNGIYPTLPCFDY